MPTTHFNVFWTKDKVLTFLNSSEVGTKHPYGKSVLERKQDGIHESEVLSPASYLTESSLDNTTLTISKVAKFPLFNQLYPFLERYTVQMLLQGQCGTLPIMDDKDTLMWTAFKHPTFFDGEVFTPTEYNYYNREDGVSGWRHSNDKCDGGYFVHAMKTTKNYSYDPKVVHAVAACGYQHNALRLFQKSCPCILMIDHLNEVIYGVPFSLEYATVEDSELFVPLIFTVHDRTLKYIVLDQPLLHPKASTGEYPLEFRRQVCEKADMFESMFALAKCAQESQVFSFISTMSVESSETNNRCPSSGELVFVQEGMTHVETCQRNVYSFGCSLEKYTDMARPEVILPILAGELSGHAALALGKKSSMNHSLTEWQYSLETCKNVLIICEENAWNEQVMQSLKYRINGILLFKVSSNIPFDKAARDAFLDQLNIIPARMMGPLSVILVQSPNGLTYLYRGSHINWPCVILHDNQEGDEVVFDQNIVHETLSHIKKVVPVDCKDLVYGRNNMSFIQFVSLLKSMTLTDLQKNMVNITDVLAQMSIVYNAVDLENMKSSMRNDLLEAIKNYQAPISKRIRELLQTIKETINADESTILTNFPGAEEIYNLKQTLKSIDKQFVPIMTLIESLSSKKYCSKKIVSKQQVERRACVQKNVQEAEKMTTDEIGDMLMDTSWSCMIAKVASAQDFETLMWSISKGQMEHFLKNVGESLDGLNSLPFATSSNCLKFTPETVPALLCHEQKENHPLATDGTSLTFYIAEQSCLILPCFSDDAQLDGSYVDFMSESNKEHIAKWRILTRGSLCSLKSRIPISKTSRDLNFGLQTIVLSVMYDLSQHMRLDQIAYNDSTCQLMRSMMYLFGTIAASGQKPVTWAFQLLQPTLKCELPQSIGDWTIYALICMLYPFTKNEQASLVTKVRLLLIRVIRKQLVDPVTEPMRKMVQEMKAKEKKLSESLRNISLQWNGACCYILNRADPANKESRISESNLKKCSGTLLKLYPQNPTYTSMQLKRTLQLSLEDPELIDWNIVRKIISAATCKRSGAFASVKLSATKDISQSTTKLKKAKKIVAAKLHVSESELTVQNEECFKAAALEFMKGDGELNRNPWRISSEPIPDEHTLSEIKKQMESEEATEKESGTCVVKPTILSLAKRLEMVPSSKNAVKLANNLDTIVLTGAQAPQVPFSYMMEFVGIERKYQTKTVQDIVWYLLDGWQDVEKSEKTSLSMIFGQL